MRRLILLACLLSVSCGGVFLPPGPPGRVCVFNLQGEIVPKGDCGCYVQTGAFTWKGWKLKPCPSPSPGGAE